MTKNKFVVFGTLLFLMTPTHVSHAFELRGIQENNSGVRAYNNKNNAEAFDRFARGLGDLPFDPKVHYNLGRTLFENKEYEKAHQESLMAAKLSESDAELKFLALFLAASALSAQKKVDDAIATYQEALEIKPDSIETKTNIELLIAGGQGGESDESGEGQAGDKEKQDQQGQGKDDQEQQQPQKVENPRPTPRPFQSQELSKKDVENILDELRAQEENVRSKFQREGTKDAPKERDW